MVTQHHECTNVINRKYYVCFTTHTHTHNFLKKKKEKERSEKKMTSMFQALQKSWMRRQKRRL